MSNVYTHTYVRNKYLMMEVSGFVARTIRLPVVRKVVEHGVSKKCLDWLEIYLHDGATKRASVRFTIDWAAHEVYMSKTANEIDEADLPGDGEVTSEILSQLADLFNDFKRDKSLTYWYNMGWLSDSGKHDAACGITRNGRGHLAVPNRGGSSKRLVHERLRELGMTVDMDTDD